MRRLIGLAVIIVLLSPAVFVKGSASDISVWKFDEFGDIKCEDEYARLDNFALQLLNEPNAHGIIVFYGGKTFRGKLPRRGEAEARAARLKPYLVQRRGIPADRIIVVNGGYMDEWKAELWIRAPAAGSFLPLNDSGVAKRRIKFRKGRVNPRAYRCEI
jgi:hypothetical protein